MHSERSLLTSGDSSPEAGARGQRRRPGRATGRMHLEGEPRNRAGSGVARHLLHPGSGRRRHSERDQNHILEWSRSKLLPGIRPEAEHRHHSCLCAGSAGRVAWQDRRLCWPGQGTKATMHDAPRSPASSMGCTCSNRAWSSPVVAARPRLSHPHQVTAWCGVAQKRNAPPAAPGQGRRRASARTCRSPASAPTRGGHSRAPPAAPDQ